MPLSELQQKALGVLRAGRSSTSYFAGSLVLAQAIARAPNDFDIHHRSWPDAERAMARDRSLLEEAGLRCDGLKRLDIEVEATFTCDGDILAINWVVDEAPLICGAFPHDALGFALHLWDVVAKKAAMVEGDGGEKHIRDLRALRKANVPLDDIAARAAGARLPWPPLPAIPPRRRGG